MGIKLRILKLFHLILTISILVIWSILKIYNRNNDMYKCFCIFGHLHCSQFASIINKNQRTFWAPLKISKYTFDCKYWDIYIYICLVCIIVDLKCISFRCTAEWFIHISLAAAATAKSLQSCPTLFDPIDGSPPGSPVPGILQARTLEWVAISFSNAWKWKCMKVKSLSRVRLRDPMDCSLSGSSAHGIFQARVLEWVAIAFSDNWN